MKYADQMGSGTMICIPSFIKIGSGIQKLIGGDTQTCRYTDLWTPWWLHKSTFIIFKIRRVE
jgi:hypothetical protein